MEAVEANTVEGPLDSDTRARKVFCSLMAPLGINEFYRQAFEKKAVLIQNRTETYLDGPSLCGERDACRLAEQRGCP